MNSSLVMLPNISDIWCWSLEGSQEFLVKSSHILIDNTILPKAEFPTRWLRVVSIKVNVHAWRVCLDKLPTRANISLRGIDIPSIACPLCNSAVESSFHIFFACPLAREVWRNFLIWWELEDVAFNSYNEWLNWIVNIRLHKQLKVFLEGTCYVVWWSVPQTEVAVLSRLPYATPSSSKPLNYPRVDHSSGLSKTLGLNSKTQTRRVLGVLEREVSGGENQLVEDVVVCDLSFCKVYL
uniref:RNA-directed DNA polymerase, eukaryota n=1 Tax=Tanacetum cinerariifolium TaxID=118510 RepID=A0A6L2P023_TANCI|nr:RNA-directed DNA polymerase, eukaryota [Tanacetum cinerariifolium]